MVAHHKGVLRDSVSAVAKAVKNHGEEYLNYQLARFNNRGGGGLVLAPACKMLQWAHVNMGGRTGYGGAWLLVVAFV